MTTATATARPTFTIQRLPAGATAWETVRPASKKSNGRRDVGKMAERTGLPHRLIVGDGWDDAEPIEVVCTAGDPAESAVPAVVLGEGLADELAEDAGRELAFRGIEETYAEAARTPVDTEAELALVGDEPAFVELTLVTVIHSDADEMTGATWSNTSGRPRPAVTNRGGGRTRTIARTGTADRLPSGGLRGMVADWLIANRGTQITPSRLAKQLGRSAGAVHNALETLVEQGLAVRTSTKPKTYTTSK